MGLVFQLPRGHRHRVTVTQSHRVFLHAAAIRFCIEGIGLLRIKGNTFLAAQHIDLHRHLLAFKELAEGGILRAVNSIQSAIFFPRRP